MGQIRATFGKTIKEFLRSIPILFWTIVWPIIWVLIGSFSFTGNAPASVVPYVRGAVTVPMMVFALMVAGIANFPGNIAEDRDRGLLFKLMSMPVRPWKDFVGRISALLAFSSLAVVSVIVVGLVCGARFSCTVIGVAQSIGFLLLICIASAGIGMLIASFIKHVHGAIMTGVAVSVVTASLSGVMAPYSSLPSLLQGFARVYPISSCNSSIIYLLVGEDFAGYNPLDAGQVSLTMAASLLLFAVGLIVYSKYCWRKG